MLNPFDKRCLALPRREVLARLLALGLPAVAVASTATATAARDPADVLRAGGCVLMLRHAATDPGIGDPPEFNLAVCSTQRNLSPAGRAQAQRIGTWFKQRQLNPSAVRTSAWCRCQDTARLAFGQAQLWPALNSVFNDRVTLPDLTQQLRQALAGVKDGTFEVWVTHQVNITGLCGEYVAMGEACLLNRQGKVLARLQVA